MIKTQRSNYQLADERTSALLDTPLNRHVYIRQDYMVVNVEVIMRIAFFCLKKKQSGVDILPPERCDKIRKILQPGGRYHNPKKQMELLRVIKGKRR